MLYIQLLLALPLFILALALFLPVALLIGLIYLIDEALLALGYKSPTQELIDQLSKI